jgi:hypothetical protein
VDLNVFALQLTEGELQPLRSVPRATGGSAGVFTLWFHHRLLYVGRSRVAARDAKSTNVKQADGVRGRLVGVRRQPTVGIQRALDRHFHDEFESAPGVNPQAKSAALLDRDGYYRVVEFDSGQESEDFFRWFNEWLMSRGLTPLAESIS